MRCSPIRSVKRREKSASSRSSRASHTLLSFERTGNVWDLPGLLNRTRTGAVKRGLLAGSFALNLVLIGGLGCNGTAATSSDAPPPVSTSTLAANTVKPAITWPSADAIDARALEGLGDARSQLSRSPVPVLAPSSDLRLERPTVVVEGEYYAITARVTGATIGIQGTRVAHRHEGIDPHPGNRALRKGKGFVTVNEGIRSASFIENGAAYTVDVECASASDARCQSDAFVVELVSRLAYVGGAGR